MDWLDPPKRYPFQFVEATAKIAMAIAGHRYRFHAREPGGAGATTRGRYAGARRSVNARRRAWERPYTGRSVGTALCFTAAPAARGANAVNHARRSPAPVRR